jgi:hypothetical protein
MHSIKDEKILKQELGKMIENQVGKNNFSCLAPDKCKCKCKKFKYKKIKKISRGAAIVGLAVAGAGCITGAFLVAALTMGAGIIAAPPLIFGGIGLMTGAFFEFERGHIRRTRKKSLLSCYKGKLLDPHDYGIDIYVEGSTPLSDIFGEEVSEIFLSSSFEDRAKNSDKGRQPERETSSEKPRLETNSPYVIQLPHSRSSNESSQRTSQQDTAYKGTFNQQTYGTPFLQPINYESPFSNGNDQFPSQQQQVSHFQSNPMYQENIEALPLKWSVPYYIESSENNNMSPPQYANYPYLRQAADV